MFSLSILARTRMAFLICLAFAACRIQTSKTTSGNVIKISEPSKNIIWLPGQHSFHITWSQSMFCFQWNIELLDTENNKVSDVSASLSEFKEGDMEYQWLLPSTIKPGVYHIKVSETSSPLSFGISEPFTVKPKNKEAEYNKLDAFLTPSSNTPLTQFSSVNSTADQSMQPHERRREKKVGLEKERFSKMNISQYGPQSGDPCTIDRVHKPSKEHFMENYMKLNKPAIITGMAEGWKALEYWNFAELGKYLKRGVKVDVMDFLTPYTRWDEYRRKAASGHREPVKVKMSDFHHLYPELMKDIQVPNFFENEADFMEVVDDDIRPSGLSFEMASQRNGNHWQVESLNASSWIALFAGSKRWGLYPPQRYFVPGGVHNNHRLQDSQLSQPFVWWAHTHPHLPADHRPIECIQEPGEILFIPSGWWWSNLNLKDSITLQKSFCDKLCIRSCLLELRERADSGDDNYFGDVFIQLRHHLLLHHPELLTDEDLQFSSPVRGRGDTEEELEESFDTYLWEHYFEGDSDDTTENGVEEPNEEQLEDYY